MSTPKHTTGPWSYEVSFDPVSMTDKLNLIGDGRIILQHIEFLQEAEADSRLVAAAPMLLKALENLIEAFRVCIGNQAFSEFNFNNSEVKAAFAAINKAKEVVKCRNS